MAAILNLSPFGVSASWGLHQKIKSLYRATIMPSFMLLSQSAQLALNMTISYPTNAGVTNELRIHLVPCVKIRKSSAINVITNVITKGGGL